jgi:hypothetical protein
MHDYFVLLINNSIISQFTEDSTDLLCLFFEDDRRKIRSQEQIDLSQKVFGPYLSDFDFDYEGPIIFFQSQVGIIKNRLAFLGFDNDYVRDNFNNNVIGLLLELEAGNTIRALSSKLSIDEQISLLQELDFNDWLVSTYRKIDTGSSQNLEKYMALDLDFLIKEPLGILYCILQNYDDDNDLILDVTEEYHTDIDYFVNFDRQSDSSLFAYKDRFTIITEGNSDSIILNTCFSLIHPELKGYLTFFDFESTNLGGGTGNLANLVKAFIGLKITDEIIALFDNDTAAHEATMELSKLKFPNNIRVVHLPSNPNLCAYPCIGVNGVEFIQVNGIAASIELFLGECCLRTENHSLSPIILNGFSTKTNTYQGVVREKAKIFTKFNNYLSSPDKERVVQDSDIDLIFKMISNIIRARNNEVCRSRTKDINYGYYFASLVAPGSVHIQFRNLNSTKQGDDQKEREAIEL